MSQITTARNSNGSGASFPSRRLGPRDSTSRFIIYPTLDVASRPNKDKRPQEHDSFYDDLKSQSVQICAGESFTGTIRGKHPRRTVDPGSVVHPEQSSVETVDASKDVDAEVTVEIQRGGRGRVRKFKAHASPTNHLLCSVMEKDKLVVTEAGDGSGSERIAVQDYSCVAIPYGSREPLSETETPNKETAHDEKEENDVVDAVEWRCCPPGVELDSRHFICVAPQIGQGIYTSILAEERKTRHTLWMNRTNTQGSQNTVLPHNGYERTYYSSGVDCEPKPVTSRQRGRTIAAVSQAETDQTTRGGV